MMKDMIIMIMMTIFPHYSFLFVHLQRLRPLHDTLWTQALASFSGYDESNFMAALLMLRKAHEFMYRDESSALMRAVP